MYGHKKMYYKILLGGQHFGPIKLNEALKYIYRRKYILRVVIPCVALLTAITDRGERL